MDDYYFYMAVGDLALVNTFWEKQASSKNQFKLVPTTSAKQKEQKQ